MEHLLYSFALPIHAPSAYKVDGLVISGQNLLAALPYNVDYAGSVMTLWLTALNALGEPVVTRRFVFTVWEFGGYTNLILTAPNLVPVAYTGGKD